MTGVEEWKLLTGLAARTLPLEAVRVRHGDRQKGAGTCFLSAPRIELGAWATF